MKFRLIAIILTLAFASWAQTAPQGSPATTPSPTPEKKAACPCCEKMAGMHQGNMTAGDHSKMSADDHAKMEAGDQKGGCCHDMKDGKCDMSACSGKDGMSCMKGTDDKSASADSKSGCCAGAKGCCSHMDEKDKAAMKCCAGDKCDRHEHSRAGGV